MVILISGVMAPSQDHESVHVESEDEIQVLTCGIASYTFGPPRVSGALGHTFEVVSNAR